MKITVSGWAGAGSSTLAILLAHSLEFKLIQGGEVFRYIYKNIGFETKGEDRNEAHKYVEPYFGPLYDEYIDKYLLDPNRENTVIESDITSFRLGKLDDVLSIFLMADVKVRAKRTQGDDRPEDGEIMESIDVEHRDVYQELYGVDVLDETQIRGKHKLVIDNSKISIGEEIKQVVSEISRYIEGFDGTEAIENADKLVDEYWEKSKDWYKDQLKEKGLIPSPQETLKEIIEMFPEEFAKFPEELKTGIQSII